MSETNLTLLDRIERLLIWVNYEENLNDLMIRNDIKKELNLIKNELIKEGD